MIGVVMVLDIEEIIGEVKGIGEEWMRVKKIIMKMEMEKLIKGMMVIVEGGSEV